VDSCVIGWSLTLAVAGGEDRSARAEIEVDVYLAGPPEPAQRVQLYRTTVEGIGNGFCALHDPNLCLTVAAAALARAFERPPTTT